MDGGSLAPRFHMAPPRFGGPSSGGYRQSGPRGPSFGYNFRQPMGKDSMNQGNLFDGKRMRNKAILRRTVDYNASIINHIESRRFQRDGNDRRAIMTDPLYCAHMLPPPSLMDNPMNCVTTRFVRTSTNKIRCPIFCVCWTPEGRRLITGASSGEFTLWNGLTFNFETILQAHDSSVRAMVWGHFDQWMLTADHGGFIKYWQSNMNNVKMYQAHKDPIRGLRWAIRLCRLAGVSSYSLLQLIMISATLAHFLAIYMLLSFMLSCMCLFMTYASCCYSLKTVACLVN